jgi:glycosyltransferase involved in cell wall biosynthesis
MLKIVVSNPSFQHTPRLIQQLLLAKKYNVVFCTTFAFYGSRWQLLSKLPLFRDAYFKRNIPYNNALSIKTHPAGWLYFLFLRWFVSGVEKRIFYQDSIHDKWVSKWLNKSNPPAVFIGSEKSCLLSMTALQGASTFKILDLAQVHPHKIAEIRGGLPSFQEATGSELLFNRISQIKIAEYAFADQIWVLSEFVYRTMLSGCVSAEKLRNVRLGVDESVFRQTTTFRKEGSRFTVVFAGIVSARKGIRELMALAANIDKENLPIQLLIVGAKGNAYHLLEENKFNCVRYLGYLNGQSLAQVFNEADVFVFPTYLDSWGMAVAEAMACGLPVIVTENAGASELVSDKNGIVIPVFNADALWNAVLFFFDKRANLSSYSAAATEAVKYLTWEAYGKSVINLIDNASGK